MAAEPPPPPRIPTRDKLISYDPDIISRHIGNTGVPKKYLDHRKSSIPFNDRAPRVRFLRSVEPHGVDDLGSHLPASVAPTEGLKPILKKSNHPILVDYDFDTMERTRGLKEGFMNTNDALEGCTTFVEQVIQYFSKADREARGSLDILTFPVAAGAVEALSRFQGNMVTAILALHKLKTGERQSKEAKAATVKLVQELTAEIVKSQERANGLVNKARVRHKQWGTILCRKGEFQVTKVRSSKMAIYMRKVMPENVTLYEDVMEESRRYRSDGLTRIYRSGYEIILKLEGTDLAKDADEVRDDQLSSIVETALEHAKDLIYYARRNMDMAFETLGQSLFDLGFAKVNERLTSIEFDAFFDPLCALELKTALGDIASRKGDLVNTAEHIVSYFKWMENFTKVLMKYVKQDSAASNMDGGNRLKYCLFGRPLTVERMLDLLNGLGWMDFMTTIPLTERVERCLFEVKPESKDSKVVVELVEETTDPVPEAEPPEPLSTPPPPAPPE